MNHQQEAVDRIFQEAIELEPDMRSAFLDQRCDNLDPSVRDEIEKLLEVDEAETRMRLPGANPHLNVADFLPAEHTEAEGVGHRIGKYHLLQQLGEGGMGVVYMADQQHPVKRRVALKVIKPGMDSKSVVARFEAERQALAMMDHPNIAKVLDVGTTDSGRPYFVMELVKGIPITQYCDENGSSVRQRLELFESVCHAVQHAHQKGIIHRDLKPSNILVAEYDDIAVPKVIDFGLAKALQHSLTEKTLFTQFGQIVGTFEYMSPEQAKLNQLDIDTRTDIYSLGVLLYELLTGQTPFDPKTLRGAAFDEMLRVIRDIEPPKPSTRLTAAGSRSSQTTDIRRTDSRKLQQALAGDLDAITMKSLSKDRTRRYQSGAAFAEDIRRFLDNEPVVARAPSSLYRMTKFVARHRLAVGSTAAILLALLVALASVTWLAYENRQLAVERLALVESKGAFADEKASLAENLRRQLYVADVELARRELEAGNIAHAEDLLKRHIPTGDTPDLRQFEWYHVWRLCQESKPELLLDRKPFSQTTDGIPYEVFIRDGVSYYAAQQESGEVAIGKLGSSAPPDASWKPPIDGTMTVTPAGHLAFASPGPGSPRRIVICDAMSGAQLAYYDIDQDLQNAGFVSDGDQDEWGATNQIRFSQDGSLLALRSDQYAVMCWEVSEGFNLRPRWHLPPLKGYQRGMYVYASTNLEFSHDAKRLAMSLGRETIVIDTLRGKTLRHLAQDGTVRFTPEGNLIIAWKGVHIWGPDLANEIRSFDWEGGAEISADGKTIAIGGSPIVRLRSLETGELLNEFRGHIHFARSKFSPKGDYLLTLDRKGLNHWNIARAETTSKEPTTTRELTAFQILSGQLTAAHRMAFHPSGKWLACAAQNTFELWDLSTPRSKRHTLDAGFDVPLSAKAWSVEFSNDGKSLMTAGFTPWDTRIWEWPSKRLLTEEPLEGGLSVLDSSGRLRAITKGDGFDVMDTRSNERVAWIDFAAHNKPTFSPSGMSLAVAGGRVGSPSEIRLLDIETNKVKWVRKLPDLGHARNAAFSPDGTLIAASFFRQETIPILHADDGRPYGTIQGHSNDKVYEVAFSPDGRTIVSTGSHLTLWDIETLAQRFVMQGTQRFGPIAFAPDGKTLAVGHGREIWVLRAAADNEVDAKRP